MSGDDGTVPRFAIGERVAWWSNTGALHEADCEVLEARLCPDDCIMTDLSVGATYRNVGAEWVYRTSARPDGWVFERYLADDASPARGKELARVYRRVCGENSTGANR